METIDQLKEFHHNTLGVIFDFDSINSEESDEKLIGPHPDFSYVHRYSFNETSFYATSFSFGYKGARITGSLPRVPAGRHFDHTGEFEHTDLLPALERACGFPIDAEQVEAE